VSITGRRFGEVVRLSTDNEFDGAVCKVLDSYQRDDVDLLIVQSPDGHIMNVPAAVAEVVEQEEFIYGGSGKRSATPEEVQRVREAECERNGHSFDAVLTYGSLDPQRFLCSNCGEAWRVVPSSEQPDDQLEEGAA
jgi:hypothetical protein